MTSTLLVEDAWSRVTVDAAVGLVRYERNELAYPDADTVERSYLLLRDAIVKVPPGMKLLIDIRRAPPRNDEAFEAKANVAIAALTRRFTKVATLVRTAVGKLQSTRLAKNRGAQAHVFDDEKAAVAYLTQSMTS